MVACGVFGKAEIHITVVFGKYYSNFHLANEVYAMYTAWKARR